MRNVIWTGTCTAIVGFATAAIFAQAPQAPQTPPSPPAAPQSATPATDGKLTITGCLKPAPSSPTDPTASATTTGTSGTTSATATAGTAGSSDAKFLLTDATSAPAAATPAEPTAQPPAPDPPATAAAAGAPTGAATYRLIANPSALTPHVGKKLAITGTIEKETAASTSTSPASGADATLLAFRVESGKILAETCTGQ
jgi:hypothetical protein